MRRTLLRLGTIPTIPAARAAERHLATRTPEAADQPA